MPALRVFLIAVIVGMLPQPVRAAARLCGTPVLSAVSEAAVLRDARRAALDDWRRKAERQGKAYTSWRLAKERRSRCARLKDGRHACVVLAVPCRIVQRVPPGLTPRRRLPSPKLKPLPGRKQPDAGTQREI